MLVFAACASAPTADEIAAAEIGPRPDQAEAEAHALRLLAENQLTRESCDIEFVPLRRGYYRPSSFGGVEFGWQLDARVEPRSKSQSRKLRRTAGSGANRFFWRDGRCVAHTFETRMFDGSRRVTTLVLAEDEPKKVAAQTPQPANAAGGRVAELLARRDMLRDMRYEAQDDAAQVAAIDALLTAVDRELKAAGYDGR